MGVFSGTWCWTTWWNPGWCSWSEPCGWQHVPRGMMVGWSGFNDFGTVAQRSPNPNDALSSPVDHIWETVCFYVKLNSVKLNSVEAVSGPHESDTNIHQPIQPISPILSDMWNVPPLSGHSSNSSRQPRGHRPCGADPLTGKGVFHGKMEDD